MSAVSKLKKKFSSLDIKKHYKGKGVETQQSSVTGRHGLQSLGKVQTVNLPSLKSENLGNDPTVNLVQTGPGSTWGTSKESSQPSHQQETASRTQQTSGGQSRSSSSAGGSAPQQQGERGGVGTASHHRHQDQRQQSQQQSSSSVGGVAGKSWSSVTTRGIPFDQKRPPPSSGWATATGDVDYSVKLAFSDDEYNTSTTTSSSQSRATAGRDGGDKRSSQPDQMSKSVDRSSGDRSPDRRSQSEQRSGREYDSERDRGRAPPPMSPHDPPRDGWNSGGSGGGQYPPYPPGHMMHPQQRMQFDMWQRAQSAGGGKMQPPNMPPPGANNMSYNMPYRMPYPGGGGPPGGGGGRSGPPSRDIDLWIEKQRQIQSEVMSAVEKARSRRAADGGGTSDRNEQGGDRRSRSGSESSFSEQNSAAMSRSRYNDRPRDNRKQHSQKPLRFQQRSVERSRKDRDPERQQHGEEGRPLHPQHPPSAQGGPGWPMGWPMPPPMGFMPGMPMPTMPPPPFRPRNNSRGSDDERRTADTQGYGVTPDQVYEIQMRHWMHIMIEFAKNHPDAPKPPVTPHIMMAAAQAQHRGQPFPQGPLTSAVPMPTLPRPRNNRRGSDDERRTPDSREYGVNPDQVYEIQMRQWMHMMTEFPNNHPDAPKPPVPPHIMMAAAQAQHRGQPFPQSPPTFAALIFYTKKGREEGATEEAALLDSSLRKVAGKVLKKEWSKVTELEDGVLAICTELSSECSLLFVSVMSHGRMGALYGSDDIMLPVNDLIEKISNVISTNVKLVLLIQACQVTNPFLPSREDTDAASIPIDAKRGSAVGCMHIDLVRPNTVLLMATATGGSALRIAYVKALAAEISKADGVKDMHQMHTDAVKVMRNEIGAELDDINQHPLYKDICDGTQIVLPAAASG